MFLRLQRHATCKTAGAVGAESNVRLDWSPQHLNKGSLDSYPGKMNSWLGKVCYGVTARGPTITTAEQLLEIFKYFQSVWLPDEG